MALGLQSLGQLVVRIKRLVESAADVELSVQKTGRPHAQVQEDSAQLRKKLEGIEEALTTAVQEYEEELQTKRDQIEASADKEDGKAQLEEKLEGSGTEKGYEDAVKAAKKWIATFDSVAKELVLLEATLTREAGEVLARPLPRPIRATAAKLPKLTLQTFDGADTLAYLPFMDSFTVHVDVREDGATALLSRAGVNLFLIRGHK